MFSTGVSKCMSYRIRSSLSTRGNSNKGEGCYCGPSENVIRRLFKKEEFDDVLEFRK